ncbi:MAG: FAD-dependent oxidoreductase [Burkholderiales bacterium]|nr:FAD-dependent oxidoreductase [Burkholderiales bacterium]
MSDPIVIVGDGQAGVQAAEALRAGGHAGEILLFGDEPHGPYHRPPLSKAWLAGEIEAAQLVMRSPEMLARKAITLRTGCRVTAIDRAACTLTLSDGTHQPYAGLVLATGATPRRLNLPGAQAPGVCVLRTRDEASAIAEGLARCAAQGRPLVVIGGGFIGLEVAATARKKGIAVTVLEAAPRLMGRALAPLLGDWFAKLHRSHGVEVQLNARIAAIETDAAGHACGVRLQDGPLLPAGLVLLGVGVDANDALAREAGLACERGIVVDACGRTDDPLIVAAGDCTARRAADGGLLRLESVNNATEGGKSAAAALLGVERPFAGTPWFWSDQYDRKLQMAGLSTGADQWALRGTLGAASFSVYHYRAGRLIAVDSVNAPKDHLTARKLLDAGVSPAPEQAGDEGFALASLLG